MVDNLGMNEVERDNCFKILDNKYFNDEGVKIFDYGTRIFKVILKNDLSIEIFNDKNKKIEKLPAPGKNDDREKGKACIKEFNNIKQLLYVIDEFKQDLENKMILQYRYNIESWRKCFLSNIIMKKFALGLIWSVYYKEEFLYTFKVEEDGTFLRDNNKVYNKISDYKLTEIYEDYNIRLTHVAYLKDDKLDFWKNILIKEEINQPLLQLYRKSFEISEEDVFLEYVSRFQDITIPKKNIGSKMIIYNWYSSFIGKDAAFVFYREFKEANIGAEVSFRVNGSEGEYLSFDKIRFYILENVAKDGGQCYCLNANNFINPNKVDKIIFSQVLYEIQCVLEKE